MNSVRQSPVHNRIEAVMAHIPRYAPTAKTYLSAEGVSRLAEDAGVPKSTISRLLTGRSSPSALLLLKVAGALSAQFGKRIELGELISATGRYPTESICEVLGCKKDCWFRGKAAVAMHGGERRFRRLRYGVWSTSHRTSR